MNDKLADFNQRLSLAEAGRSVGEAAAAGAPDVPPNAGRVPTSARSTAQAGAPDPATNTTGTAPTPAASVPLPPAPELPAHSLSEYRIQAASPGLAVLQVATPGVDEPGIVQVAAGDRIPGLGHIISIAQRGLGWEVRTDRGVIR